MGNKHLKVDPKTWYLSIHFFLLLLPCIFKLTILILGLYTRNKIFRQTLNKNVIFLTTVCCSVTACFKKNSIVSIMWLLETMVHFDMHHIKMIWYDHATIWYASYHGFPFCIGSMTNISSHIVILKKEWNPLALAD